MQDFLQVYRQLREELVTDDLIAGQPGMARDWLEKASSLLCCLAGLALPCVSAFSAAHDSVCRGSCPSLSLCFCSSGSHSQLPMQMLDYNVPGGKLNRGMAVLDVVKALRGKVCLLAVLCCLCCSIGTPEACIHCSTCCCSTTGPSKLYQCLRQVSPDEVFKANALGWCIEWLQAYFLVADDMMDNSVTRRGQPCWYRNPKVRHVNWS